MVTAFGGHPHLRMEQVGLYPPERYRVVYEVPGLWFDRDTNTLKRANQHVVDILLPADYPRGKPYCTTAQPIFHPNFGAYICIADFWSPAQSLVDVVIEIGDLIQFKLLNTRSPLNAVAAHWAMEHIGEIPIGSLELGPQEPEIRIKETSDG